MSTMRKTAFVAFVAASVTFTGCGGDDPSADPTESAEPTETEDVAEDNGVADLEADAIAQAAGDAAESAESAHMVGDLVTEGQPMSMDIQYGQDSSGGSMILAGSEFELLNVGDDYFMKADHDTWVVATGDEAAADALADKYVAVSPDNERFGQIADFLDREFMTVWFAPNAEFFEKGETTEIDGVPAITLTQEGQDLYVATDGEPYPLRIEVTAEGEGSVDFVDWGEPVELDAPPEDEVVDISEFFG